VAFEDSDHATPTGCGTNGRDARSTTVSSAHSDHGRARPAVGRAKETGAGFMTILDPRARQAMYLARKGNACGSVRKAHRLVIISRPILIGLVILGALLF
jgi:hypothetical protein